jgi:ribosomal protein S12 methylthiotransferase accessory factor
MAALTSQAESDLFSALVSSRVGIIRSLVRMSTDVVEPTPAVLYEARLSDFDFLGEAAKRTRVGVGKGETEDEAVKGAIGEAIERYCAWQPDYEAILEASAKELGSKAISPPEFVMYSEAQYEKKEIPYRPFDEQRKVDWVRGRSLPEGEEVFVPASLTYLGHFGQRVDEQMCLNTSNGLAAGSSVDAAVLSGLYELIERDGFLITWMNKLSVAEINFDGLGGLPHQIRTFYQRFGIEIRVFNATTDIPVYVMMGFAIDRSGDGPTAVVGLGCSLNPAEALKKALLEVCQGRVSETWRYRQRSPQERIRSFPDVRKLEDHGALFAEPEMLGELAFLLKTSRFQRLGDLADRSHGDVTTDLTTCVKMLQEAGSRVAYADLTTPDVTPLGLRVVRAIATGLQPIHFGYRQERLGGQRLYEVPRALGYVSETRTASDLNRCPHPLP